MLSQVPLPLTAATQLSASCHLTASTTTHCLWPMTLHYSLISDTKEILLTLDQWNGLLPDPQMCLTPSHFLSPPTYLKYLSLLLLLSKCCQFSNSRETHLFPETFLCSHQPL